MKAIDFEGRNVIFGEGQSEYEPLPAFKDEAGTVLTVWEFTPEERQKIAAGENLKISMMTFNKPLMPIMPYIGELS